MLHRKPMGASIRLGIVVKLLGLLVIFVGSPALACQEQALATPAKPISIQVTATPDISAMATALVQRSAATPFPTATPTLTSNIDVAAEEMVDSAIAMMPPETPVLNSTTAPTPTLTATPAPTAMPTPTIDPTVVAIIVAIQSSLPSNIPVPSGAQESSSVFL